MTGGPREGNPPFWGSCVESSVTSEMISSIQSRGTQRGSVTGLELHSGSQITGQDSGLPAQGSSSPPPPRQALRAPRCLSSPFQLTPSNPERHPRVMDEPGLEFRSS